VKAKAVKLIYQSPNVARNRHVYSVIWFHPIVSQNCCKIGFIAQFCTKVWTYVGVLIEVISKAALVIAKPRGERDDYALTWPWLFNRRNGLRANVKLHSLEAICVKLTQGRDDAGYFG